MIGGVEKEFPCKGLYVIQAPERRSPLNEIFNKLDTLVITLTGVVAIFLFPEQFLSFSNATGAMKAIGMIALPILCAYIPLQGCLAIMIAVLQGLGEGKRAMLAGLCERLLFPLACMYLLAMSGALDVVWWSFAAAETLGLVLCSLLMRQAYVKKVQAL